MLKVIRVSPEPPYSYAHPIDPSFYELSLDKKVCVLKLIDQYDGQGNQVPGKCSKICKHGYLVCTEDFTVVFPLLIEGGLSNAQTTQEEVTGQ